MNREQLAALAYIEKEVDALLAKGCKDMSYEELRAEHDRLTGYMDTIIRMRRNELYAIINTQYGKKNETSRKR